MAMNSVSVLMQCSRAIRTSSAVALLVGVQTVIRASLQAVHAPPTPAIGKHYMITWLHFRDALPHSLNYPCSLMSKNDGKRYGEPLIANDQVCVADACGDDLHQHFIRAGLLNIQFLDRKGLRLLARHCRCNLHSSSPFLLTCDLSALLILWHGCRLEAHLQGEPAFPLG